jgi:calcium-dependent protein kinase
MNEHYYLGKVIGAGSFGTVREATEACTGHRYAIKTVSKIPKRGPPSPRCLGLQGSWGA